MRGSDPRRVWDGGQHGIDGDALYSAVDRKPKRSQRLRRIENARVFDAAKEQERALALLVKKYPQYGLEPLDGPVLAVDVTDMRERRG